MLLLKAPLGLNLIEVLIHLLNLTILIIAVRFLLYKPIKKFIDNREKQYDDQDKESERKRAEAAELKEQYEKLLSDSRKDAARINEEVQASAQSAAVEIVSAAKEKAGVMLKKAEEEAKRGREEEIQKIKQAVPSLAVSIASEILEREVNEEDNDAVIQAVIKEWENQVN